MGSGLSQRRICFPCGTHLSLWQPSISQLPVGGQDKGLKWQRRHSHRGWDFLPSRKNCWGFKSSSALSCVQLCDAMDCSTPPCPSSAT